MSIVSYAQNFEDVMLWRALGHIERGLYVDIGAQHPLVDSVSMAFHEAGWRGVHIEPVPAYAELLRQARPGDTVLQVALGAAEGILDLHVIDDSGLSTAVGAYAEQHAKQSGAAAREVQVPMLTLNSALRHLAGRDVHWLKIDVEGFEEQVLRGWDSSVLRPWILVVEATKPGSPETDFAAWDPLVTSAGYRCVYFDGLNRFYVAEEHAGLAAAFAAPPNVFDGAQLSGMASAPWCHRVLTQAAEAARTAEEHALWLRNEWDAASARGQFAEQALGVEREKGAALEQALHGEREALATLEHTRQREHEVRTALELALHSEQEASAALELAVSAEHARNGAIVHELAALREHSATAERELSDRVQAAERELAALDDAQRNIHALTEHNRQLLDEKNAHVDAVTAQWAAAETALQAKIAELQHWSHHWFTIAEQRELQRVDLINSTSWRLTAPLRRMRSLMRGSVRLLRRAPGGLRRRGAASARSLVRWAVRLVLSNQRLSHLARGVLGSHPALKARLRQTTLQADVADRAASLQPASHPAQLSERAGRLYQTMRAVATEEF
jgi:FkbM family methyltransferase